MSNSRWLMAIFMMAAFNPIAWADHNTAMITVNVTIYSPPCEINNNQNIEVDFGSEVAVTDVAAGRVEKPINYELDCTNADIAKTLKMVIVGTGADFNAGALKASIDNLGVMIKADGSDFPLNTPLTLASKDAKPSLTALLVQKPGARLQTGDFNAVATMTVGYQ